jgi:hypothetical protein
LIAVTLTAIGFAYDAGSGNKELGMVFASSYVLGCIFAVLAVRQSAIFTAVIQPPLILFCAVPTAYFLFHGGQLGGIKDLAINCGYPLIERFPLMFFTSAAVLLVGMGRWYYGMSHRGTARSAAKDTEEKAGKEKAGSRVSSVTSKLSSLLTGERPGADDDAADPKQPPRRKHTTAPPARAAKSSSGGTRSGRATKRATPSRSRHARPPETEIIEPIVARPRRPRTPRQSEQPPPTEPPRRRTRSSSGREPRKSVPPAERRTSSYDRSERRRLYDDYPPRDSHVSKGNGTHHPISRVRYRGGDDASDNRADHRPRPRSSRNSGEPDSWEYDI